MTEIEEQTKRERERKLSIERETVGVRNGRQKKKTSCHTIRKKLVALAISFFPLRPYQEDSSKWLCIVGLLGCRNGCRQQGETITHANNNLQLSI